MIRNWTDEEIRELLDKALLHNDWVTVRECATALIESEETGLGLWRGVITKYEYYTKQ